jgi:outer membrane protein
MILAALALSVGASAQKRWTLRECVDHATEHNIDLRRTALGVESAELELNTSLHSRLPSLNASVSQNVGFGRSSYEITDPNDPERRITVMKSTQIYGLSPGISTSLPVFQGFRIGNQIKADRLDLAAAAAGLEQARESLELNVAALYLDVLFKKEILAAYREQTAVTRKQVENTAAMLKVESVAASQLYEIQAQLAQNEVSEVNADNALKLSLLNLAQALNLPDTAAFDVAEVAADGLEFAAPIRSAEDVYAVAVGERPSVREAELRLGSSELAVKIARSGLMPSLSLSANMGTSYQHLFGQDAPQESLSHQLRNRHSESVGLGLSIPIFNRNATRNSVRAARLGVRDRTLALEGVKTALFKEIEQARQGAVSAAARYGATTKALEAAREAFRSMEVRYTSGNATVYEYSDALSKLTASLSEQAQAKFEYLFRTRILDFYYGGTLEI